ncbi:MAG: ABC transporter substrate binding protein [Pseudolabrys sp.]
MRRRELISLLGGAAAWPLAARAQQPSAKVFRIGFLGLLNAGSLPKRTETFRASLRDLGYQEGRDFVIEYRWADGNYDRLPTLVEDLIRLKVDVIVTHGTPGVLAAKQATTTIPIVMAVVGDALGSGHRVQPCAARRERNRFDVLQSGTRCKATRAAQGGHAGIVGRGHPVEFDESNE